MKRDKEEDFPIRFMMFTALILATGSIYDVVINHYYVMIISVLVNGLSIWFGLDTLRMRRIRRMREKLNKEGKL